MESIEGSKNFVFRGGGRGSAVIIANQDLEVRDQYFPFINRRVNASIPSGLNKTYDNKILFRRPYIDTVYQVTSQGVKPYVIFDFLEDSAPAEEVYKPQIDEMKINNYPILFNYMELENHFNFICLFLNPNKLYQGIFNKKTNETLVFSRDEVLNDISFENKTSYVIGIDPSTNSFIYQVEPNSVIQGVKLSEDEFKDSPNWQKASNLVKQVSEEDNPILIFAKLKE